jgi:hypothetical protein
MHIPTARYILHVDELRAELLEPAHRRCDELDAEIREAERRLTNLIRDRSYDDAVAKEAQLQLEDLNRDRERWQRRWRHLEGMTTNKSAADLCTSEEA